MGQKNTMLNATELCTGKEVKIYVTVDGQSYFYAEAENVQVQMNITNAKKQPLGSTLELSVMASVAFTASITEMVIRDDLIMKPLLDAVRHATSFSIDLQTVIVRSDGEEQRMSINSCVPDGSFDLFNVTPGDVVTRQTNYALNEVPEYISKLASSYAM